MRFAPDSNLARGFEGLLPLQYCREQGYTEPVSPTRVEVGETPTTPARKVHIDL
jgi:hypothetical protein